MNLKRIGLIDFLGSIVFISVAYFRGFLGGDPGIGWHMRTGQWIAKNLAIPRFDPFLFSESANGGISTVGKPWIANQWLADYGFWQLYAISGWQGLQLLTAVVIYCAYPLLLVLFLRRHVSSPLAIVLALLLCYSSAAIQWFLRPVIFSFLFFSLTYIYSYRLAQSKDSQEQGSHLKHFIILPLLFLVWSNLHPAFVLGLLLLCIAALSVVISSLSGREPSNQRLPYLLVLIAVCFATTFITPFGLGLYRNIFALAGSSYFMHLNAEWLSPALDNYSFSPFFLSALLLIVGFILSAKNTFTVFEIVTLLLFLAASFSSRRYIPFFSIVSVLPLAKIFAALLASVIGKSSEPKSQLSLALSRIEEREKRSTVFCYSGLLILLITLFVCCGGRYRLVSEQGLEELYPSRAVHVLKKEINGQASSLRLFHTPDWGGYLIWNLWPASKLFIDDRNYLNGEQRYRDYFAIVKGDPGWRAVVERYGFNWMLLQSDAPLVKILEEENWIKVFADDKAVLFRSAN